MNIHTYKYIKAPLRTVRVVDAHDLSTGASLYFQFTYSMSVAMLFMTIFAGPAIIFSWFGTRIARKDQDAMGLYR